MQKLKVKEHFNNLRYINSTETESNIVLSFTERSMMKTGFYLLETDSEMKYF